MDGRRNRAHIHLIVHHEQVGKGGTEEGPIDVGVHAALGPVDVLALGAVELDGVLPGEVLHADGQDKVPLAQHPRAPAKISPQVLSFLHTAKCKL